MPVLVSIPEVTVAPGGTIEVPVEISDVTGLDVVASDLLIYYDARVVTAKSVRLSDTLTNRWTQAHRVGFVDGSQDTTGLIDIALATANRIPSGAGVFVYVEFEVLDTAQEGDQTILELVEAILNSEDPATTVRSGSLLVSCDVPHIQGDFNGDCVVNFLDFVLFAAHFGSEEGDSNWDPVFDLDNDGRVGFSDFLILVSHLGETCE